MMMSQFSKQNPGSLLISTVALTSKCEEIAIGVDFSETERERMLLNFNQEHSTTSVHNDINMTSKYKEITLIRILICAIVNTILSVNFSFGNF